MVKELFGKKKTISLKVQLYSIFIVSFGVLFTLISLFFLLWYFYMAFKQADNSIDNILKYVEKTMEMQNEELSNFSGMYYSNDEIFREIESLNNPGLYEHYDIINKSQIEKSATNMLIKTLHISNQKIRDVVFFPYNSDEQTAYYLDKGMSAMQSISYGEYETETWFLEAVRANGRAVLFPNHTPEYLREKPDEEVYSSVRLIKDMYSDKPIGVVKIDVKIENLEDILKVLENKADGLFITDEGAILAYSKALQGMDYGKDGIRRKGSDFYYQKSLQMENSGWNATYLLYLNESVADSLCIIVLSEIVILFVLFVSFQIYRKRSQRMLGDVQSIVQVLKSVQEGNFTARLSETGSDEVREIKKAVNHMTVNLQEYIEQKYVWAIRQQKAEYMALQSQINPHFLYNTLNGFVALNRMGEKRKLEQSIIKLTHLFRYTCTQADVTTLAQEVQFLSEYLELEKMKYEDRLEFIFWMDEACKSLKIPKLLLQPIVENSIIHGMGDRTGAIMITLVAQKIKVSGIGSVLLVDIRDNGVGFQVKEQKEGAHIGMENVKKRLELYNKHSFCQVVSVQGKGTKTTLVFPEEADER